MHWKPGKCELWLLKTMKSDRTERTLFGEFEIKLLKRASVIKVQV